MNGSYDDAYDTRCMALQQRGFYNMTLKWFGDYANAQAATALAARHDARGRGLLAVAQGQR